MNFSFFKNKKYFVFVLSLCFFQSCFHLDDKGVKALDDNLLYVFSPGRIDAKANEVLKDDTNDVFTKALVTSVANSIVSREVNLKLFRDSTFVFEAAVLSDVPPEKGTYSYLSDSAFTEYLILQFENKMESQLEIFGNHFDSLSMPMEEGVPVIYIRKKLNDYFRQNASR